MDERMMARLAVVGHALVGVLAGLASFWLAAMTSTAGAIVAGVAILLAFGTLLRLVWNKDRKWLLANGAFIYFFVWLVAWTYFLNVGSF